MQGYRRRQGTGPKERERRQMKCRIRAIYDGALSCSKIMLPNFQSPRESSTDKIHALDFSLVPLAL